MTTMNLIEVINQLEIDGAKWEEMYKASHKENESLKAQVEALSKERDSAFEKMIKAQTDMWKLTNEYEEYAKLLVDELNEVVGIAAVHGWKSSRAEEGYRMRQKIQELKNKNNG